MLTPRMLLDQLNKMDPQDLDATLCITVSRAEIVALRKSQFDQIGLVPIDILEIFNTAPDGGLIDMFLVIDRRAPGSF